MRVVPSPTPPVCADLPDYLVDLVDSLDATDEHLRRETWWAGFSVGRDGLLATPPDGLDADLAEQWRLGYESGYGNWESEVAEWAADREEEEAEAFGALGRALHYCEMVEFGGDAARNGGVR